MTVLALIAVGLLFLALGYRSSARAPQGSGCGFRVAAWRASAVALLALLALTWTLGLLLPVLVAVAFAVGAAAGQIAYRLRVWRSCSGCESPGGR